MRKIAVFLLMLFAGVAFAQEGIHRAPLAADSTVNVASHQDTLAFTVTLTNTSDVVEVFASGPVGRGLVYWNGSAGVKITPGDAATLKVWGFPCDGTIETVGGIDIHNLEEMLIFDAASAADSLEIVETTSGISLAADTEYFFPIDVRASGDDYGWGPVPGLLIKLQKTDGDGGAETFVVEVIVQ